MAHRRHRTQILTDRGPGADQPWGMPTAQCPVRGRKIEKLGWKRGSIGTNEPVRRRKSDERWAEPIIKSISTQKGDQDGVAWLVAPSALQQPEDT